MITKFVQTDRQLNNSPLSHQLPARHRQNRTFRDIGSIFKNYRYVNTYIIKKKPRQSKASPLYIRTIYIDISIFNI